MNNRAVEKINNMGKWAHIITIIGKIALIIASVAVAAALMICTYLPQGLFDADVSGSFDVTVHKDALGVGADMVTVMGGDFDADANFTLGSNEYGFVSAEETDDALTAHFTSESSFSFSNIRIMLWGAFAAVLLTLGLMWFASDVCKALRYCDSPFESEVLKALNRLMYALIPWVVLFDTAKSVIQSALSGKVNIVVGVDLGKILVVLLMVVLINVFRHGAELQQQADETL